MSSGEALSGELDKLVIAAALPQVRLLDRHLPLSLNPFYAAEQLSHFNASTAALQLTSAPHEPGRSRRTRCRKCRQRRCSESVLDEYKAAAAVAAATAAATAAANSVHCNDELYAADSTGTPRTTPGVQRRLLKKGAALSTGAARGKQLLRAPVIRTPVVRAPVLHTPVLRALQICLRDAPTNGARRRLLHDASEADESAAATAAASELPTQAGGISDFRDLISECQTLLASEVSFKKKNFMSLRERQLGASLKDGTSTNTNIRSSQQLPSQHNSSSSISHASPPPQANTVRGSQSPASPEQSGAGGCSSSSAAARAAANNTSCSQQASATPAAAVADDVTIDELACYFDTLVHIPKKMSSMAEMMYI